jgi:hypothetical protein
MTQLDMDMEELYNLTERQAYLLPGRSSPKGFAALNVTQLHTILPQRLSRLLAMVLAFDGAVSVAIKLRTMPEEADVTRMNVEAGESYGAFFRPKHGHLLEQLFNEMFGLVGRHAEMILNCRHADPSSTEALLASFGQYHRIVTAPPAGKGPLSPIPLGRLRYFHFCAAMFHFLSSIT